jgi:serpin B
MDMDEWTPGEAIVKLASRLYYELPADDNLLFSPASIMFCMGMVTAGSDGETKKELDRALIRCESGNLTTHGPLGDLLRNISDSRSDSLDVSIANALWPQEGYPINPSYLQTMEHLYKAGCLPVNYQDPKGACALINRWVSGNTKGKISEILTPDDIDGTTKMVLTNAVYFKGTWAKTFSKKRTSEGMFLADVDASRRTKAQMMHQTAKFMYTEDESSQTLSLDYKGGEFCMDIFLPKEKNGIRNLDLAIDRLQSLTEREVKVHLPRFKFESSFSLKESLESLGVHNAFGMSADFSKMEDSKELFLSDVVHKACIEVNEEGAEAAAASAAMMLTKGANSRPEIFVFKADHPFAFQIRHKESGAILFTGRVCDVGGKNDGTNLGPDALDANSYMKMRQDGDPPPTNVRTPPKVIKRSTKPTKDLPPLESLRSPGAIEREAVANSVKELAAASPLANEISNQLALMNNYEAADNEIEKIQAELGGVLKEKSRDFNAIMADRRQGMAMASSSLPLKVLERAAFANLKLMASEELLERLILSAVEAWERSRFERVEDQAAPILEKMARLNTRLLQLEASRDEWGRQIEAAPAISSTEDEELRREAVNLGAGGTDGEGGLLENVQEDVEAEEPQSDPDGPLEINLDSSSSSEDDLSGV